MSSSDLSEPDPFGAAPFNLGGSSKTSKGSYVPRPNQLPLSSSSGLPDHDITSYVPLYSEEPEVELQLRHRHSSENSSASHEGSQSVHSSRSGKELFSATFIRAPLEDRSKYEKLLNDDFELKSPLDVTDSIEKVPYRITNTTTEIVSNVEFRADNDDSDSIGSASDLRERVDSSGEDDGSSAASDDGNVSNMPKIPSDQNVACSSNIGTEKIKQKSPGLKEAITDALFTGHIESGQPLLDEDSSDDDQNEALLPGNVKGSNSSSMVVSPVTAITPPSSPGEKSRSLDVFGAAPFKRLSSFTNPAKAPLLSQEKADDVFAQAPFRVPFKGQKDSFKNSLKKKKNSLVDNSIVSQNIETFSSAPSSYLPDVVPGVELSARKNSVKYIPQESSNPAAASTSPTASTDLFGSAPFSEISEKDLVENKTAKAAVTQPLPGPTQVSNIIISYQKQVLPQPVAAPAPLPPPTAGSAITRRKSNQDLFGAVPFSAVAPALASQKKLPPPVAPKPKNVTRTSSLSDQLPSSSISKPVTDNGNISRESSGSFSSESCDESKLTSSVDKSKYKELIDEDSMAHDENVNVVMSGHYTQLKPAKKSRHFKKKEAKDKISSTNAFSNMSFEDIVSDDESQYTQSFLHESSSIKRTSNSFRIAKIN